MRIAAALAFATILAMPGLCNASISLIISAPAASAASATLGWRVSTETTASLAALKPSSTGRILDSSSSESISIEPGLVDSAPKSIIEAPCLIISRAVSIAAIGSGLLLPSKKESCVILTIPMIQGKCSGALPRSRECPFGSLSLFRLCLTCVLFALMRMLHLTRSRYSSRQVHWDFFY
ncbi:MAG: hypothetical protein BWX81_01044 [Spirochaetes bacterium ADurb.Bin110]|nr:MAG: hypothetical protein BWX81_01044 [Spirochaetes bacterium ADurb.Bin110]